MGSLNTIFHRKLWYRNITIMRLNRGSYFLDDAEPYKKPQLYVGVFCLYPSRGVNWYTK